MLKATEEQLHIMLATTDELEAEYEREVNPARKLRLGRAMDERKFYPSEGCQR
ncbi:hypothetical protein ACFVUS_12370 [Nocardia sp. NPDC058058]|uniref:hypothetical protein n=1 Tax=Nocardia sp. NPDC058058 TaxID=3346317 RepID=UPI0036DDC965